MEEQGEVTHRFWAVSHADRIQVATAIVERSWPAIVFSRTQHGAERLSKQLNKAGIRAEAIHGDRSQSQRERALGLFRQRRGARARRHRRRRPRHPRRRRGAACCSSTRPRSTRTTSTAPAAPGGPATAGTVITLVTPEKEKDVRKLQRELRRREPIEAATAATAASVLAATAAEADRPRRRPRRRQPPRAGPGRDTDRAAERRPPGPSRSGRPAASPPQGHQPAPGRGDGTAPGASPRKPAAAAGRNGQERAGCTRSLWSPWRQARPTTRWCRSRPPGPPRRRQRTPTHCGVSLGRPQHAGPGRCR